MENKRMLGVQINILQHFVSLHFSTLMYLSRWVSEKLSEISLTSAIAHGQKQPMDNFSEFLNRLFPRITVFCI